MCTGDSATTIQVRRQHRSNAAGAAAALQRTRTTTSVVDAASRVLLSAESVERVFLQLPDVQLAGVAAKPAQLVASSSLRLLGACVRGCVCTRACVLRTHTRPYARREPYHGRTCALRGSVASLRTHTPRATPCCAHERMGGAHGGVADGGWCDALCVCHAAGLICHPPRTLLPRSHWRIPRSRHHHPTAGCLCLCARFSLAQPAARARTSGRQTACTRTRARLIRLTMVPAHRCWWPSLMTSIPRTARWRWRCVMARSAPRSESAWRRWCWIRCVCARVTPWRAPSHRYWTPQLLPFDLRAESDGVLEELQHALALLRLMVDPASPPADGVAPAGALSVRARALQHGSLGSAMHPLLTRHGAFDAAAGPGLRGCTRRLATPAARHARGDSSAAPGTAGPRSRAAQRHQGAVLAAAGGAAGYRALHSGECTPLPPALRVRG